jgi:arachidonate 15-lipoxygenase
MKRVASLPQNAANRDRRKARLERVRARYVYKKKSENQLWPVAVGGSWPWLKEYFSFHWLKKMIFSASLAWIRRTFLMAGFLLERLLFRFDKMRAYERAFPDASPAFGGMVGRDDAFGYWRIAGANALSLRQEKDLVSLRRRIPFDRGRVEKLLAERSGHPVSLETEATAGRLFAVDFGLVQRSLRPARNRDSRWREKYLPAPIGVFLEARGYYPGADLVPLAIQIDQVDPSDPADTKKRNPVYYPDDGQAWDIAKLYFEVGDVAYHVGCGHVFRTHFAMTPFCLSTPRQLSDEHPVFMLLRPHTRFTLEANNAAYKYFTDRRKAYFQFYAGTLEEQRQVTIESYKKDSFREFELGREIAGRNVDVQPECYPFRDDAELWIDPIHNFVKAFIEEFYRDCRDVQRDWELQAWATELGCEKGGAVRELVPGGKLNTREQLIALLAQVLFIAGPGHAAQHFSSNYYYRYPPGFPGAAYAPPVWDRRRANRARFQNMLPPIGTASKQVVYNTFGNLQYDEFGHYERYPLGRLPKAKGPIAALQAELRVVEEQIQKRQQERLLPYEFLLPSRVPNSTNI